MGLEVAAIAGGASLLGGIISANAQQGIAEDQLRAAMDQRGLALHFAQMTPSELSLIKSQTSAYRNYLQFQQQDLMRQGDLLKQYQSAQGDVLAGRTPTVLSPMEKQFDIERQQLASRMRATGGSGMSGSSAGMQQRALQEQSMGLARMNSLQGLAALGGQASQVMNQGAATGSSLAESVFGMHNAIASRQIAAANAVPVYQYAGAGGIGASMLGASLAGMGNNVMNAALLNQFAQNGPYRQQGAQPSYGGPSAAYFAQPEWKSQSMGGPHL